MSQTSELPVGLIECTADGCLAEWARWTRNPLRMGYPHRSITEKFKEGGITAGSPRPPTALPDEVALTDRAVARIRNQGGLDHLWQTINIRYVHGAPLEALGWALGISRSGAYRMTKRAQRAVYHTRQRLETTCRGGTKVV